MTVSAAGKAYPSPVYGWYVVGVLVVVAIVSYTDRQVLSLVVDPIRRDLDITDTQISLLLGTAFALVYGVVGLAMGYLADRWNRRNLIAVGATVWSLATIACGLAPSFAAIVAARAFVACGEAILTPAAVSLISDYFGPKRRGTAVAVYITGIPIGGGVATVIGGLALRAIAGGMMQFGPFVDMAPWRLVLLLIGGPGLLMLFLIFSIREPLRREDEPAAADGAAAADRAASPAAPWLRLAPLFVAVALISLVDNAAGNWVPSLLIRNFAMAPSDVGLWFGVVSGLSGGAGVLMGGILGDRAVGRGGKAARIRVCLGATLIGLPFAAYGLAGSGLGVLIGVGFYFLMSDAATVAGISAVLDYMPNRLRGLATSAIFFLNVSLGAGFGPTIVALLVDDVYHDSRRLDFALSSVGLVAFVLVAILFRRTMRAVRGL
jgi:MFS family permease